jgi:hypothetical protein
MTFSRFNSHACVPPIAESVLLVSKSIASTRADPKAAVQRSCNSQTKCSGISSMKDTGAKTCQAWSHAWRRLLSLSAIITLRSPHRGMRCGSGRAVFWACDRHPSRYGDGHTARQLMPQVAALGAHLARQRPGSRAAQTVALKRAIARRRESLAHPVLIEPRLFRWIGNSRAACLGVAKAWSPSEEDL